MRKRDTCPCDHDMTPPLDQHFHVCLLAKVVIIAMVKVIVEEVVNVMTGRRAPITIISVIGGDDTTEAGITEMMGGGTVSDRVVT